MSSLLTNTSAMTALQTLRGVSSNLATTQNRISTGLRVSTASDNAAYWSIATTMRSDNMALSAVQDALGLGAATIDTMYTGLNGTVDVVSQIKAKLVAARTPGVDRGKIQSEITELQKQLKNTADSAVFNGENWISVDSGSAGYNASKSVVSSFSRAGGVVSISSIAVSIDSIKLYDKKSDLTPATNVVTGVSTGTFAAAVGFVTVQVGTGATLKVATTANSTLASIAQDINQLGIKGLTAAVDNTGQLTFANRNASGITIVATAVGLTPPAGLATAPATQSVKGALDSSYDAFDATTSTWQTFSTATVDISKLSDNASDLARRRRQSPRHDHRCRDQPRCDQEPHRPAAELRQDPDRLARSRYWPARRRGHECRINPPAGPPGPAAARYPGPVDRQLGRPEHPVAVQVVTNVAP